MTWPEWYLERAPNNSHRAQLELGDPFLDAKEEEDLAEKAERKRGRDRKREREREREREGAEREGAQSMNKLVVFLPWTQQGYFSASSRKSYREDSRDADDYYSPRDEDYPPLDGDGGYPGDDRDFRDRSGYRRGGGYQSNRREDSWDDRDDAYRWVPLNANTVYHKLDALVSTLMTGIGLFSHPAIGTKLQKHSLFPHNK